MKEELIAPCGMNCTLCIGYQRDKNKCIGCKYLPDKRYVTKDSKSCVIKNCETIKRNKTGFCYECDKYPCQRLKQLDKRYRTKYGMSMIENLNNIKNNGISNFLSSEEEKWKCKNCSNYVCVHKNSCINCKTIYK